MLATDLHIGDSLALYNKERCKVIGISISGKVVCVTLEYIDYPGRPHSTITLPVDKSIDIL